MPLYDFSCSSGHLFEKIVSIAKRKGVKCPHCNNDAEQRLLTAPRIDEVKMGMDPDFPTAYEKWGRKAHKRMSGFSKDSNNSQLVALDADRIRYNAHHTG